ncbi:MAG: NADH-quinone oxidoreductase subunit M, partial [Thiothrix sp.]|nr:NADH-quinone oxidoreductase subunit M [Thiothrix sp.]
MLDWPILSFLIWFPILGGAGVLLAGERNGVRQLALAVTVLTFLVSLLLYAHYDLARSGMQFAEQLPWINAFGIRIDYALAADGIAIPLIILNSFITILVILAGWEVIQYRPAQYMAAFLIMEGLVNGVFAAQDAILFYIFFEGMLIPMFLI